MDCRISHNFTPLTEQVVSEKQSDMVEKVSRKPKQFNVFFSIIELLEVVVKRNELKVIVKCSATVPYNNFIISAV
jgi:predicted nucleic acid-binding Zn ribbon protein